MKLARSVTLLALASVAVAAQAVPVTYVISGIASGELAGDVFVGQTFTLTGIGDTDNIGPGIGVLANNPLTLSFAGSFGSGTLTSLGYSFVNDDVVGLGTFNKGDLINLESASYTGLPLDQSFGPQGGTTNFIGQFVNVSTSAGLLSLRSFDRGTFEIRVDDAPTVPGPLAALPFALMALKRRKRA